MTQSRAVATLVGCGRSDRDRRVTATSWGCAGAPPGAYSRVTERTGEITSNEIARTVSRTMPIGPWGTSGEIEMGGQQRDARHVTVLHLDVLRRPAAPQSPACATLSTMSCMLATSRSHRTELPESWAITSFGRGTGHQLSPQALKSACHGSAIALLMVSGSHEEIEPERGGVRRLDDRAVARVSPPASMPGKNAPPTQASSAARSRPSGVMAVAAAGTPVQSLA